MSKPFRELSDKELWAEFEMWNEKVVRATSWGAALMQAAKWRDQCERYST